MSTYIGCLNRFLNVKALVAAFNQERAHMGILRDCENVADGSFAALITIIMQVSEQFWAYTFLAYIAECGGFVGLFLGYSLLQIEDLLNFCRKKK